MKSAKFFAGVLLFISFSFTNCSPSHDYLFTTNEIITRGNWGIEFFVSQDKTAQYGNYTFQFSGNGVIQGSNGVNTVKGSWAVIHDVDRSDILTITMNEQNSIAELSNVWNVKAKTTEALKLQVKGSTTEFRIRKL
jgi:hypothetical protein